MGLYGASRARRQLSANSVEHAVVTPEPTAAGDPQALATPAENGEGENWSEQQEVANVKRDDEEW